MADFKLLLPSGHGIIGTIDERGIVTFIVSAGPESAIRGTEMFNLMLRAFAGEVTGIHGVWRRGFQGRPSINLGKVNELTGKGIALDDAIKETWTASRAKRWGFDRISVLGAPEGTPGAYVKMDVLIEK